MTKSRAAYIIWWAIGVHLAWGVALIVDPAVGPAAILVGLHWVIALGISGQLLGMFLIVAALLAAVSLLYTSRLSNIEALVMLLPQYALLVAAFVSDAQSIANGILLDKPIDRLLLFTALFPVMLAALLHSAAIIERHTTWIRRS